MTAHMLIAPYSPRWDRKWFDHGRHYAMRFVDPPDTLVTWTAAETDEPLASYAREHSATLRRVIAPGWKVPLAFWVDDRLGLDPEIPSGYAMPGWLWNVDKESSPLCEICQRRADTPAGRLCFEHLKEHLVEIMQRPGEV